MSDLAFHRYEQPEPEPAGVTTGWLVIWSGKPGPASVAKVARLVDDDGVGIFEVTGPFEPTTVTAD